MYSHGTGIGLGLEPWSQGLTLIDKQILWQKANKLILDSGIFTQY